MHDKLTRKDIEKMQEELDHRILVVRKEALDDVKEARALGDLSENFEYKAAKQFKNKNESRIRYLQNMIKTAIIVEDEASEDEIGLNDTVKLYMSNTDRETQIKIVTTIRADALLGRISIESPIGKALLGHKVGEDVKVMMGEGNSFMVKVLEITKSDAEDEEINSF